MSRRPERLASTIQQEIGMIILRELNDPRLMGLPSITRVKVTPDLEYADIYMSVMGTPGQQTAALNALKHSAGLMRTRLTKDLSLRQAPFIRFHLDTDLKKEMEMMALLDQVARENAELDRKRAEQQKLQAEQAEQAAQGSQGAQPPGPDREAGPAAPGSEPGQGGHHQGSSEELPSPDSPHSST